MERTRAKPRGDDDDRPPPADPFITGGWDDTAEDVPLLVTEEEEDDDCAPSPAPEQSSPTPDSEPNDLAGKHHRQIRTRVILLAFAAVFFFELGIAVTVAPTNAVMESIICRQLHPDLFPSFTTYLVKDDPDSVCKSEDVQSRLAMLRGWQTTFESIPAILCTIPYGILSDRWGRKPVLCLGVFGLTLVFIGVYFVFILSDIIPLWMMWFCQFFTLIGGGGPVCTAMIFTVIADVVPVAERATMFFRVYATFLTAQMIAGPLSGFLMLPGNPWVPLLLGLALLALTNAITWAFPETVHLAERDTQQQGTAMTNGLMMPSELATNQCNNSNIVSLARTLLRNAAGSLKEVYSFILANKTVGFLMLSLVVSMLGRFVQEILLQYATKRYGWTWSEAAFLMTILTATSLITLLVILPATTHLCLTRLEMSGLSKDIWLARLSGFVQIVGCLVIALAGNGWVLSVGLVFFALGTGLSALIRSLLNSLVEEHHVGMLNTLVGFLETTGLMVAGPVLAKSLSLGIRLGGGWIGLPFLTAMGFFVFSTFIVSVYRLPPPSSGEDARQGEAGMGEG